MLDGIPIQIGIEDSITNGVINVTLGSPPRPTSASRRPTC